MLAHLNLHVVNLVFVTYKWKHKPLNNYQLKFSSQYLTRTLCVLILVVVPEHVVPAIHSLADGLGCHVASTLWDQLFRQTLVQGRKFAYSADKEKVRTTLVIFIHLDEIMHSNE